MTMHEIPVHYLEIDTLYRNTIGCGLKSVALTAAQPGEGVTTMALALARRSALAGARTVLVDLNLQHPSLDQRFQLPRTTWQPHQQHNSVVCADGSPLFMLPAPLGQEALIQLRSGNSLKHWLQQLTDGFDAVIIDTSPLNSVNYNNLPAEHVCSLVDAVLLVVQATSTRQADLLKACNRLSASHAPLRGCIINDRLNPPLQQELCRQIDKLHWLPQAWSVRMKHWIRQTHLLREPS